MTWVRAGAEFADLLRGVERSVWRWECQGTYREPDEQEPIQAWRDGHPNDAAYMQPWLDQIRAQRAAGKTWERVRMLTDPPTEYLRWLLQMTHLNVGAGEDIRWISEEHARTLGAPPDDFYLLDDQSVATLHFGDTGLVGAEVTDTPAIVTKHRRWREIVWPIAIPHDKQFTPTRSP